MAHIVFSHPIDTVRGKLSKSEQVIYRQKGIYSSEGGQIGACAAEAYVISNPRDWKKCPATGAELAKIQRFQQACRMTKEQLADHNPARPQWVSRWENQLKHPEADAPLDPRTGKRKVYGRLDNYVRAQILKELKAKA